MVHSQRSMRTLYTISPAAVHTFSSPWATPGETVSVEPCGLGFHLHRRGITEARMEERLSFWESQRNGVTQP
jgi:hypothetical protein